MKTIDQLDANFAIPDSMPEQLLFFHPQEAPFRIWGLPDPNVYCRLPADVLAQCSDALRHLAYHLAGACVRFSTDADHMAVMWTLQGAGNMPHMPASGQSGMQLFEETDAGTVHVKNLIPAMDGGLGCRLNQSLYFPLPGGGMRSYVLYLPLYNGLDELLLGFPPEAQITAGRTPRIEAPIVFYGSSITQGGCASKSGSCFTTLLARRLDAAQINLGFSGNGRGEEFMARYISSLSMSMFVMDYDHNAPDPAYLEQTHERFFQIIRQAQPELPVVMVSRPDFERDCADSRLRRAVIRKTYEHAVAAGDKNVWMVDGEMLFGSSDRDLCTVDDVHPTDLGFHRMADCLEPLMRKILIPDA